MIIVTSGQRGRSRRNYARQRLRLWAALVYWTGKAAGVLVAAQKTRGPVDARNRRGGCRTFEFDDAAAATGWLRWAKARALTAACLAAVAHRIRTETWPVTARAIAARLHRASCYDTVCGGVWFVRYFRRSFVRTCPALYLLHQWRVQGGWGIRDISPHCRYFFFFFFTNLCRFTMTQTPIIKIHSYKVKKKVKNVNDNNMNSESRCVTPQIFCFFNISAQKCSSRQTLIRLKNTSAKGTSQTF